MSTIKRAAFRRLAVATGAIAAGLASGVALTRIYAQEKPVFKRPEATENHGLKPKDFVPLTIAESTLISPDSKIIRVLLDDPEAMPDFPCTSYVLVKAMVNGEVVVRPYTPINCGKKPFINNKGELSLVIKAYPDGRLSKHLCDLPAGAAIEIKGPLNKFAFEPKDFDTVTLIAGGSGVTPIYQILENIAENCHKPGDAPKVNILIANKSAADILLKPLVDVYANKIASIEGADKVNVSFFVEKPIEGPINTHEYVIAGDKKQTFKTGFISMDELKTLDGPSEKHKVFICGPPGMMKALCGTKAPNYTQGELTGAFKELGFEADHVYKF